MSLVLYGLAAAAALAFSRKKQVEGSESGGVGEITEAEFSAACATPGMMIRSKGQGRGLARGRGRGPVGWPALRLGR